MKPICRLLIYITLLWACVGARSVTAEDVDIADCFKTDLAPAAQFVACRAAAEQGNVYAQFLVGSAYRFGDGVPQDYAEAMKWYRHAAEQGYADAENALGTMYRHGQGVPQDYAEAMKWYRRAAEREEASAQNNLGVMYRHGQGVPQDYAEAMKWYRRAAEQSHAKAQYSLGFMYFSGEGVPQDYTLAHMWFNLAGASGLEEARGTRDTVAKLMTPVQIAEAQRLAREWREAHGVRAK